MREIKEDMASVLRRLREGDILPSVVAGTEDARRGYSEGVRGGGSIDGGGGGRVDCQAEVARTPRSDRFLFRFVFCFMRCVCRYIQSILFPIDRWKNRRFGPKQS